MTNTKDKLVEEIKEFNEYVVITRYDWIDFDGRDLSTRWIKLKSCLDNFLKESKN